MVISDELVAEMVQHARSQFPLEACGLLASKNGAAVHFYPITNIDESPVNYRMDPQQQLRAMLEIDDKNWELGAIFHSHPRTRAYPSKTDMELAFYPDALYIIVSLARHDDPEIRAYKITDGTVTEEFLEGRALSREQPSDSARA